MTVRECSGVARRPLEANLGTTDYQYLELKLSVSTTDLLMCLLCDTSDAVAISLVARSEQSLLAPKLI
jgi:hypothetical protein